MRKYRDFKCQACLKKTERRVLDEVKTILCECGGVATRQVSGPKCYNNTTGGSPSASSFKW